MRPHYTSRSGQQSCIFGPATAPGPGATLRSLRYNRGVVSDEGARKTWEHLRAEADVPTLAVSGSDKLARDADARASAPETAKWRAVFDAGLVNMDSVPLLREEVTVKWSRCDEVEVRVLLRVRAGTKVGDMLQDETYSSAQIVDALCRLASRGLLQFP
jgi:hypothetical protein